MRIRLSDVARDELLAAEAWYESQDRGLGRRFRNQVRDSLKRIRQFPRLHTAIDQTVYRAYVRVFPYQIYYLIDGSTLVILSISHGHRHPDHWKDQLP